MIAGRTGAGWLSDVELVPIPTNNDFCDPLDLEYTVEDHASIGTPDGILTCGGRTLNGPTSKTISKCVFQTKEGQTTSFPSMKRGRVGFRLGIVNDVAYAIGGDDDSYGVDITMEKINFQNDSKWNLTTIFSQFKNNYYFLQFSVQGHCLATTKNSLVVTGGSGRNGVSKNILSF